MKQPFEVKASQVEVLGLCAPDFPLQKKRHSFEFLRTIAHLRPRTNTFYAVFRIRVAGGAASARLLCRARLCVRAHPHHHHQRLRGRGRDVPGDHPADLDKLPLSPRRPSADYTQDFFGKKASLTVSGQLNVETFCMAFGDVYTFGPTFRAEKS